MQMKGIHHVSINVKDVPESIKFYVDVLGLEQLARPDFGFPGAWLNPVVRNCTSCRSIPASR